MERKEIRKTREKKGKENKKQRKKKGNRNRKRKDKKEKKKTKEKEKQNRKRTRTRKKKRKRKRKKKTGPVGGFARQPENSKRAHSTVPVFKNTTEIPTKRPPERDKKRAKMRAGEGKRASNKAEAKQKNSSKTKKKAAEQQKQQQKQLGGLQAAGARTKRPHRRGSWKDGHAKSGAADTGPMRVDTCLALETFTEGTDVEKKHLFQKFIKVFRHRTQQNQCTKNTQPSQRRPRPQCAQSGGGEQDLDNHMVRC